MSDQPTAAARPPAKAQGKKYAGLTRSQWLITGGVFAVALGYILWKRHQAAAAAAAGTGTAATNQGSNECTDSNGNPVDCGELQASELAALQNQLDQLGAASGAGGSGDTGTVGTSPATGTSTTQPAATPTTSSGGTATATATKTAGAISNLQASAVTKTTAKVSWNPAANATGGYSYKVTELNGTLVKSATTKSTSVSLSGLHPGWSYNFGVQGLPGGAGNNIHFSTKSS